MRRFALVVATLALVAGGPGEARADIIDGNDFTVAWVPFNPSVGSHYHSNTEAIVGDWLGIEPWYGLVEFDLAGQTSGSARLNFSVIRPGGLSTQTAGNFDVDMRAYRGNNRQDISDVEIATFGSAGMFSTAGLRSGDTLSFDVSSLYNTALASGYSSLGFRLQYATPPGYHAAYTFGDFTLETGVGVTAVPEASTIAMGGLVLAGLAGYGWRNRSRAAA